MASLHTYHIPVMGTAFTAETPLRVAQYGINSVIALADDVLLERLRKIYSERYNLSYSAIQNNTIDFRADRITSYLNLVQKIAVDKFNDFTSSTSEQFEEIKKYFAMLPDGSDIKDEFIKLTTTTFSFEDLATWLKEHLSMGSIDVNIRFIYFIDI